MQLQEQAGKEPDVPQSETVSQKIDFLQNMILKLKET